MKTTYHLNVATEDRASVGERFISEEVLQRLDVLLHLVQDLFGGDNE